MAQQTLVVVDVETTGFGNADRIVEIAIVTLDPSGQVLDEFDTLINPERDVGPTHIHGINASMVSTAPTFAEIAGLVGDRLEGKTLVCHNVSFDLRMLSNEFDRLGATLHPGETACTWLASGERLELACQTHGVVLSHAHRALADAQATAQLAIALGVSSIAPGMSLQNVPVSEVLRTHRREVGYVQEDAPLGRVVESLHYPSAVAPALSYFQALDWALDDNAISDVERQYLQGVAVHLGLSEAEVDLAHQSYFKALMLAAQRDGVISEDERSQMDAVARALRLDIAVPTVTELATFDRSAEAVVKVCFTGTATTADGHELTRSALQALGLQHGFEPIATVTKKHCDLLVASDPSSSSGKAKTARKFDIPVISVEEFLQKYCS